MRRDHCARPAQRLVHGAAAFRHTPDFLPCLRHKFIGFDKLPFAAQQFTSAHGFANAMAPEPSGLKGDAERAMKLVAADPFFRRANQEDSLQPDMQLDVAGLKYSADFDGERFAACIALIDANPSALALQWTALVEHAAMRTVAPARPDMGFDEGVSGDFVMILWFGQNGYRLSPWNPIIGGRVGMSSIKLPQQNLLIIDGQHNTDRLGPI